MRKRESVCTSTPVRWHSQVSYSARHHSRAAWRSSLAWHRSEYGRMPYVLDVQFFSTSTTTITKLSLVAGHAWSRGAPIRLLILLLHRCTLFACRPLRELSGANELSCADQILLIGFCRQLPRAGTAGDRVCCVLHDCAPLHTPSTPAASLASAKRTPSWRRRRVEGRSASSAANSCG